MNEALIKRWKAEVVARAEEVDPDDERDWYDMAVGFFLGAGLPIDASVEHALEVTYRRG
jgi:hypothetical protein